MPEGRTWLHVKEAQKERTKELCSALEAKLERRAQLVGRGEEYLEIVYFEGVPVEQQEADATAALDEIDKGDGKAPSDWHRYLAVEVTH